MKFRYRLAPLLKVAERELAAKQTIFNQLELQQQELSESQGVLRQALAEQEHRVASMNDPAQAVHFFRRRTAIHDEIRELEEQKQHLETLKESCLLEIASAKREVYRLELIRDKMKAEFKANLQREQDKELDEMGTLRHGSKK